MLLGIGIAPEVYHGPGPADHDVEGGFTRLDHTVHFAPDVTDGCLHLAPVILPEFLSKCEEPPLGRGNERHEGIEQSALARPIGSQDHPTLPFSHGPVDFTQEQSVPLDGKAFYAYQGIPG